MAMVMTVLSAHVARERWDDLQNAFNAASEKGLPGTMVQTLLVQSTGDPNLWWLISVWRDQNALDEYRRHNETPEGVLMFRSAGVEPALSLFEVASLHS